jgi:hypothetical protein
MQFDNNTGNVGIGTTSPQANLDVHAPHVYFGGAVGNSNTGAELQLRGWNTGFNNWQISTAFQASNGLDITPSTTPGGTTFTTPAVSILRNGNVGIGTTNPSFALDVSSAQAGASRMYLHPADGSDYSLLQFSNSGGTTYFGMDNSNGNGLGSGTPYALTMYSASVPIVFSTGGSERMRIDTSGNVGIGTANAAAKLQVYTANDTNPSSITAWDSRHFVVGDDASAGGIGFSYDTVNNVGYIEALKPYVAWGNLVLQSGLGNVGINTSNPQYTLDVAGDVRANSFYSNSGTYADFVFKPGYKLEPLSDVEASIKKDGHLPGIPSEAEAKAHGINLAQMQVDLLQKIEELTLHQIDEEKRLNEQSKDIEQLRKENAELREELTK